ncbi:DUF4238 domain-containing protein [Streptacidiphilus jiangxiensis]|uniref:DUF4238 domain-containing protein n=1 Tax=Streptacidiphilus jiangxiensis TaxID=235985 RepID=A0A1H7WJ40_STRJI|nr:DUF4238 domain-containing protein [Streptacidiphilus jiangxiensis]SEM21513.1 Protein of unknown function [Streptacidiphilus jiangxiensis]
MAQWDVASADPQQQVGARHHTVPAFYIRKFANQEGQVWVRDRRRPEAGRSRYTDLAIKDFYTFTNLDGQPDGRLEQLLAQVERAAAPALDRLCSGVTWNAPLSIEDRASIATFVAFQLARGQRKRREVELQADLLTRLQTVNPPGELTRAARAEYRHRQELWSVHEVVPDPSEHLKLIGSLAANTFRHLVDRPIAAFTLTDAALLSCDEPVLLVQPEGAPGPVAPDPPARRLRSRRRKGVRVPRRHDQVIHIQNPAGGILTAETVLLPLGRRTVLAFGAPGTQSDTDTNIQLSAEDSREAAAQVNELALSRAYFFAFCHPEDQDLLASPLPEVEPLLRVGGAHDEHKIVAAAVPKRLQPEVHGRRQSKRG